MRADQWEWLNGATSRHLAGPAATPLRTPWRFKSSHPHNGYRVDVYPIRTKTDTVGNKRDQIERAATLATTLTLPIRRERDR